MARQPKVSVIVPVYKAQAYLCRCVDSLLQQTLTDFELLLIDDGSPDSSGEICDDYERRDARVRVFHKTNGGVGSARQLGLEQARGQYVIHADPDDWVEPTILEELYAVAQVGLCDIVMCDYWMEYSNRQQLCELNIDNEDARVLMQRLVSGSLHGSLCNKLVRRDFLLAHDIGFAAGLNICEDLIFCLKMLRCGATCRYLNQPFYHYDRFSNPNSLSSIKMRYGQEQHDIWLREFRRVVDPSMGHIYRTGVAYIAYWAFTHNIFSAAEYRKLYLREIRSFVHNDHRFAVKCVTTLSALGLNVVLGYMYRLVKGC